MCEDRAIGRGISQEAMRSASLTGIATMAVGSGGGERATGRGRDRCLQTSGSAGFLSISKLS